MIKDLKDKMSSLETSNRSLKEEVSTLETCNNDLNETALALELNSSKLKRVLGEKTEALRNEQKMVKKLERTQLTAGDKESEKVEDVIKEKVELEEKLEKLQTSHDGTLSEISSLKEELKAAKSASLEQKERQQQEMELELSRNKELESSLESLSSSIKSLEDEKKTQVEKNESLEKDINVLRETVEKFNTLEKDYQTVKSINSNLKEQIDLLTSSEKDIVQNLKNSEENELNLNEDIKNLRVLNEKLNKDVERLRQNCTELEQEVNNYKNQIDSLKKENDVLKSEARSNKETCEKNFEEINSLRTKVDSTTKRCDLVTQKLELSKKECEQLKTSLESLNTEVLSERKSYESNNSKLLSDNESLQEKLQLIEAGLLKKTEDWSKLVENIETLELEVATKSDQISHLERQIEEQEAENSMKLEEERRDAEVLKQQLQSKQEEVKLAERDEQLKIDLEKLHGSNEAIRDSNQSEAIIPAEEGSDWVLKNELTNREALISRLITDCNELKRQVEGCRSREEAMVRRTEDQFAQINSLVAVRIQYESNENHLKSQLSEKDRIIASHVTESDALRLKCEKLNSSEFLGEHEQLLKEYEVLKGDLLKVENDQSEVVSGLRKEISELKRFEVENEILKRNVEERDEIILKIKKKEKESVADWSIEIPEERELLNKSNKTNIYHNIPLPSMRSRMRRLGNSLLNKRSNLLSLKNLAVAYMLFIHILALRCTVHF